MIRVLGFVVLVFLVAIGFAWLADRPGDITLHFQGYEIRTSLLVAAAALLALVAALAALGALIRAILRAPRTVETFLGNRRRDRGYRALSTGMIAVGAGDSRAARKAAEEARAHLGEAPLTLLLTAQAAQLSGDGDRARTAFEALAARRDTKVLGLHGLFVEARRQGAHEAARHFAEEAQAAAPKIGWAGTALFEYRAQAGDWLGALQALAANQSAKVVERAAADRLRAALLTARAMELEAGDPVEARAAALEAHRLAPGLAPPAVVASRLLTRNGDIRRAAKVLEQAWRTEPHPELAEAYAQVRPGDSVLDRLKRIRKLAAIRANHPEGAMAIARAAIDARDFDAAREALDGLAKAAPSERVCLLMAEIEEREAGDQGKVRSWLTRALAAPRDPAWIADGRVFDRWLPVSPVSGRVAAFEWAVPKVAGPPREAVLLQAGEKTAPPDERPAIPAIPAVRDAAPAEPQRTIAPPVRPAEPPPRVMTPASEPPEPVMEIEAEVVPEPPPPVAPAPVPSAAATDPVVPASSPPAEPAPPQPSAPATETPIPPVARAPDDPGPEPEEDAGPARERRFRLF